MKKKQIVTLEDREFYGMSAIADNVLPLKLE
jgi:hypothetical protein